MKEVHYGPTLMESRELLALAKQRTEQLEEELGQLAPTVSAEWDRATDGLGHPVVTLRLSDWSGSVMAVLDPKEMESISQTSSRLNLLWLKLLRIRSHKQFEALIGTESGSEGT